MFLHTFYLYKYSMLFLTCGDELNSKSAAPPGGHRQDKHASQAQIRMFVPHRMNSLHRLFGEKF